MRTNAREGVDALTDKEKSVLRLLVRGHDAKSVARALDTSVHTINERLRVARRKLAVSSSREAARVLLEAEGGSAEAAPESSVHDGFAGDANARSPDGGPAPVRGARPARGRARIMIGAGLMMFILATVAFTLSPTGIGSEPQPASDASAASSEPAKVAERWLGLLDQGRWDDSYRETGATFRASNTAKVWADVSEEMRRQFGPMVGRRTLLSQERLPAPPRGYEVVKFRTRFAQGGEAIETVTLNLEDGVWRVVGVTVG
jgi:DNA-binding CsgD family transcriptional regulator